MAAERASCVAESTGKGIVSMSVTVLRPFRRPPVQPGLARVYVIIVVVYLAAVLALVAQGQDPVFALAVPAAVGSAALTAVERLGRFGSSAAGAARPRHA
ncbi:hypothetical protein Aglo03_15310 [Actinokineospora globicatena]|uniref:Uncharacterized protein n=1 Tax=Actinokineospora globicatena TaxID=103729 RepID=A0A9W6QL87_9PSEU|nr:hypothetical protein Aglo03_15310 [Actinokineospora globicatena]